MKAYLKLDEAGFDQVPCGTNWVGWKRRELGLNADDVMGKLVTFGRENISKNHLMGFMMATWLTTVDNEEVVQKILKGIDLLAEATK